MYIQIVVSNLYIYHYCLEFYYTNEIKVIWTATEVHNTHSTTHKHTHSMIII